MSLAALSILAGAGWISWQEREQEGMSALQEQLRWLSF